MEAQTRQVPEYDESAEVIELPEGEHDTLLHGMVLRKPTCISLFVSGEATYTHIDLRNREWVFVEGLTVNNPHKKGFGISLMEPITA